MLVCLLSVFVSVFVCLGDGVSSCLATEHAQPVVAQHQHGGKTHAGTPVLSRDGLEERAWVVWLSCYCPPVASNDWSGLHRLDRWRVDGIDSRRISGSAGSGSV